MINKLIVINKNFTIMIKDYINLYKIYLKVSKNVFIFAYKYIIWEQKQFIQKTF